MMINSAERILANTKRPDRTYKQSVTSPGTQAKPDADSAMQI